MDKIEIKIESWNDVTISMYEKIENVMNDESLGDVEKDIAMLAILCGVDEEQIWNLPMEKVQGMRVDMSWMKDFDDYRKPIKFKSITIEGVEYTIDTDIQHMTVAQYVDFQTYFKDVNKYKAEFLSVFFIPKGHKYGDGYDVADVVMSIKNNVDILTFNQVCFFLLRRLQSSTRNTLTSLELMMRMKIWMMGKDNPQRETLMETRDMIRGLMGSYILG